MGRVRSPQQGDVALGERRAPALEPRLDLLVAETGRAENAPRVRERGVTREVGSLGGRPPYRLQRIAVRLDVHLVVREQQRPVHVEEDE